MPLQTPALVELMGRSRIAGRISEVQVAGAMMLRIEVPEIDGLGAYAKLFSASAVYAITPLDEQTMMATVRYLRQPMIALPIVPLLESADLAAKLRDPGDGEEDDEDGGDDNYLINDWEDEDDDDEEDWDDDEDDDDRDDPASVFAVSGEPV